MRYLARSLVTAAIAIGASAACFPLESAQNEFVPVSVPVWTGNEQVRAAHTAEIAGVGDSCSAQAPELSTCEPVAYVRVGEVLTQPDCYLDAKVTTGEVGRVMRCTSVQSAIIVFEHAIFVGELAGDYVDVCKSTTYDFPQGDNCTWRTEQRIHGSMSGALSFAYTEGPVAGRACTLACRAQSTVQAIR